MSRKGNCYDNAPMESFWGTLKQELIHHKRYATRNQAMREIRGNILKFFTTGRGNKLGWDTCHLLPMNKNSMPNKNWQLDNIGVHY